MIGSLRLYLLVPCLMAAAQAAFAQDSDGDTTRRLLGGRAQTTLKEHLDRTREEFFTSDYNTDGRLSIEDAAVGQSMAAASLRSAAIGALLVADLDGDQVVTVDELKTVFRYKEMRHGRIGDEAAFLKKHREVLAKDKDGDGRITFAEAGALPELFKPQRPFGRAAVRPLDKTLTLDIDGDGSVSLVEYQAWQEAYFRAVDADSNGTLSHDEIAQAANTKLRTARPDKGLIGISEGREAARKAEVDKVLAARKAADPCAMPKASAAAQIIAVGAYETDTLSNIALGSRDDVTQTAPIDIEAGDRPLYVVVVAYENVIWRFTGATERIEHVVLSGRRKSGSDASARPRVGQTGIAAEKTTYVPSNNCLGYFHKPQSREAVRAFQQIEEGVDRKPDLVVAVYSVTRLQLPSNPQFSARTQPGRLHDGERDVTFQSYREVDGLVRVETGQRADPDPAIRQAQLSLRRFSPGGVTEINARDVKSAVEILPYDVLPQEAGLVQLLQSGALAKDRSGPYVITRKIRIPAGLAGAHLTSFMLADGVPPPAGNAGHSSVKTTDGSRLAGPERPMRLRGQVLPGDP